jgi:hypothetical protein
MHASRTQRACPAAWRTAEEHVGINPGVGDTSEKSETIPHTVSYEKKAVTRSGTSLRPIR